jgi:hypothetical protein
MADEVKTPNFLLIGAALAAGGYALLRYTAKSQATVPASQAWAGGDGSTTPTAASSLPGSTDVSAPAAAPLVPSLFSNMPSSVAAMLGIKAPTVTTTSSNRPGYPLDGENDIRFASAAVLANTDGAGGFLNREWGDGSRNIRVNLARIIGQQYHIYVEDLVSALVFRWNQGGFGGWDEMYNSFANTPDSLANVLTAYNQRNPSTQIAPRW